MDWFQSNLNHSVLFIKYKTRFLLKNVCKYCKPVQCRYFVCFGRCRKPSNMLYMALYGNGEYRFSSNISDFHNLQKKTLIDSIKVYYEIQPDIISDLDLYYPFFISGDTIFYLTLISICNKRFYCPQEFCYAL